ncbi:hypothetical protein R3P38DRAFT_2771271 [Favolaschia claudopus]|uniref:Uncharacterized protein n=1 Tax=Favolaschia claudopus TaxID=2862362 RepID=A0AAW0C9H1_9AGAR
MFVFAGGTTTNSLNSRLYQLTSDTSSKRYPAPFGLWQRGNAGNEEHAHLQKFRVLGASYCAGTGRFWGRFERERWSYAFMLTYLTTNKFQKFCISSLQIFWTPERRTSLRILQTSFPALHENSALPSANPPPRTSGLLAHSTSLLDVAGLFTPSYSPSSSFDTFRLTRYNVSISSNFTSLLSLTILKPRLYSTFTPKTRHYERVSLGYFDHRRLYEGLGQGCERELEFEFRLLLNKPLCSRNLTTVYRDYDNRNYDRLNSNPKATLSFTSTLKLCNSFSGGPTNTRYTEAMTDLLEILESLTFLQVELYHRLIPIQLKAHIYNTRSLDLIVSFCHSCSYSHFSISNVQVLEEMHIAATVQWIDTRVAFPVSGGYAVEST